MTAKLKRKKGGDEILIVHCCFSVSQKITFKSSSLKPLNQIKPNLAGMVPGWVPYKIVSDSPALHSRWLLLLKKNRNVFNCPLLL
jgi:hypothetical protein